MCIKQFDISAKKSGEMSRITFDNDGLSPLVLPQPQWHTLFEIPLMRFDPSYLTPISEFIAGFTTSCYVHHKNIQHVPLADKELGVHKVTSRTTHNLVAPPPASASNAPKLAWEAAYPKGSINPSATIPEGFEFYLSGPTNFSQALETASEAIFSYRMMLQDEWESKSGKLPGACKFLWSGFNFFLQPPDLSCSWRRR